MSSVSLVVFDLDGTLVDSRRDIADSANALLVASGAKPLPEHEIGRMVGDGAAVLVARAFAAAGHPQPSDALAQFLAIYDGRLLEHTRPYDGIVDVLDTLRARAALAVLTNKPLRPTRDILAGLDLARFFSEDAVVGGDGPLARKPDPAGLNHLMRQARAAPGETMLVGDSSIDWRTARNAATGLCLAKWGFGFETLTADQRREACVLDRPQELLAAL